MCTTCRLFLSESKRKGAASPFHRHFPICTWCCGGLETLACIYHLAHKPDTHTTPLQVGIIELFAFRVCEAHRALSGQRYARADKQHRMLLNLCRRGSSWNWNNAESVELRKYATTKHSGIISWAIERVNDRYTSNLYNMVFESLLFRWNRVKKSVCAARSDNGQNVSNFLKVHVKQICLAGVVK